MLHAEQVAMTRQLFDYIDRRSTAEASAVHRQPVVEYTSPAIAARERERLFRQRPLCVGLSGLLPEPGSWLTHDHSGLPLLLSRGEDGIVRALLNVCRHRGARVADGCGKARAFACPYHAWRYDNDGRLRARPEEAAFAAIPREELGLTALPTLEQDGLIWVLPDPSGTLRLDDDHRRVVEAMAGFDLPHMHLYDHRVVRRRMNWKLVVDTFLESYHFCVLHQHSICRIFYDNLTAFDTYGAHFRLVSARRSIEELRGEPPARWNLLPYMVAIYVLFPGTIVVWQLDHVELWQVYPVADKVDEAVVVMSLYTPEPPLDDAARGHWERNIDLVMHVVENEDFPLGEGVQQGFLSPAQEHILFGRNEPALTHFHRAIGAALGD